MFDGVWPALRHVLPRVTSVIGLLTLVMGLAAHLSGKELVLPAWLWWLTAIVALFVTAVRIQMELDNKGRARKPTVSLKELVERIAGSGDPMNTTGLPTRIGNALIEIRQQATLGVVATWGRRGPHPTLHMLEAIPSDHWKTAQIDYLQYLKDVKCKTGDAIHPGAAEHYSDIHFDAIEVHDVWPDKTKRLTFRLPFVWQ